MHAQLIEALALGSRNAAERAGARPAAEEQELDRSPHWTGGGGGWGTQVDARYERGPPRYDVAELARRVAELEDEAEVHKHATVGNETKRNKETELFETVVFVPGAACGRLKTHDTPIPEA